MPPTTQVNSATGIMAVTGGGKSYQLALLARWVWERYKKVTLYYNSDGGGFPAAIQELQALGIMRVFRMRTRDPGDLGLAFETAYRCYQGWWPRRINPSTGEVPPGVEMVPPIALRFEMRCKEGHLVKTVPSENLLLPAPCPTCRAIVTKADMQVTKALVRNKGFEDVGAVSYDGLSSVLSWELMEMGQRAGRLELKGEEGSIGGKIISGDLKFGANTRSHVGFAQSRGEELVHLTLGIPNLVVPPVITMLTHEDVDERGLSITGPKIAGRAKTDEAPQWFGNLLELAKIPNTQGNGEQRVMYLREFTDGSGRRHLCKIRGNPGTMPAILADPANGDENAALAGTVCNLGLFFQMLDQALQQSIAAAQVEIPDAPGLPDGWVEIGDASIVLPPAVSPVQGPPTLKAPAPVAQQMAAPPAAAKPRARRATAAAPAPPAAAPVPLEAAPPAPVAPPVIAAPAPIAPPVVARPPVAPPPGARPPAAGTGASLGSPAATPVRSSAVPPAIAPPISGAAAVPRPPAAAPRPPAATPPRPRMPGVPGPPD